jgi:hypothetical protein
MRAEKAGLKTNLNAPMRVMLFEIWKHGGTAQYARDLADALSRAAPAGSSVTLVSPGDGTLPQLTGGAS